MNVCKIAGSVANSIDPDQTPQNAASDQGLYYLFRPDFFVKYDNFIKWTLPPPPFPRPPPPPHFYNTHTHSEIILGPPKLLKCILSLRAELIPMTKTYLDIFDPLNPLLYSKTGVFRGIHYALCFFFYAQKHRLSVLVRTASPRRFKRVPTIYVLCRNMKNIRIFI